VQLCWSVVECAGVAHCMELLYDVQAYCIATGDWPAVCMELLQMSSA
jgi:predicted homoserine dehydrogenase-like protein